MRPWRTRANDFAWREPELFMLAALAVMFAMTAALLALVQLMV